MMEDRLCRPGRPAGRGATDLLKQDLVARGNENGGDTVTQAKHEALSGAPLKDVALSEDVVAATCASRGRKERQRAQ